MKKKKLLIIGSRDSLLVHKYPQFLFDIHWYAYGSRISYLELWKNFALLNFCGQSWVMILCLKEIPVFSPPPPFLVQVIISPMLASLDILIIVLWMNRHLPHFQFSKCCMDKIFIDTHDSWQQDLLFSKCWMNCHLSSFHIPLRLTCQPLQVPLQ